MSTARHHADWLSLVEVSGPFLSMPVLLRAFPQGLDAHDPEGFALLRQAAREWEESRDPAIHQAWVRFVLRDMLGFPDEALSEGPALPPGLAAQIAEHGETLRPDLAVINPGETPDAGKPRLLVQILPPDQDLDRPLAGKRWKAAPATRMMELLHATDARLGLVTNGDRWMLVDAPRGETTGFASWYTSLWLEEQLTLRAFRSLLGVRRFFGVPENETLEALLTESASDQQEVTDQLGKQVRKAVEIVIQALDRIDKDRGRTLLEGVDEKGLYEAALTVMMRLVFLLSVEERELLLLGDPLYDQFYAISTLRAQLRETADQYGEEVLERRQDAWSRLLATFRAVHGGVEHEAMRLPAYGGHLFDPDRFPFLEGRPAGTSWRGSPAQPLPIHNRTVLHLLEALQLLQVRVPGGGPAEARLLSFRALDIEQIGHVYEGLLDHTAVRAKQPVLGLIGSAGKETEIPLPTLEGWRERGEGALIGYLKEETGRSEKALAKDLSMQAESDEQHLRQACDNDPELLARARPFAALLRQDTSGSPVVIAAGSVYVTQGSDRRSTGTHYTPRSLTEPIVRYTLEPLVYVGPAEGTPKEEWRLRPAHELLALKICDMAMGSGAFLVQACRYLAERLVEAWEDAEQSHDGRVVITPEGDLSTGDPDERPIPRDPDERLAVARRIVADRCLYGVDVNPMAVEMAKLSLWLVTLQKDRPFTFLDHALRCGDSLLGVDVEQLSRWSLEREEVRQITWFEHLMAKQLKHALGLRRQIGAMEDLSVRETEAKARLLAESDGAMTLVKLGADLLIATALADKKEQRDLRESLLWRYQLQVSTAEDRRDTAYKPQVLEQDRAVLAEMRSEADRLLHGRRPFHWPLEFPEVFVEADALGTPIGFDALVGNPPFLGGKRITGVYGTSYRDYLLNHLANGARGNADLCAYFFLRGRQILRTGGDFGMLATNTIAQGDTREVGLEQLVEAGCTIPRAVPSRKWPGTANLEVAHVWIRRGSWNGDHVLSDEPVAGVTPFLSPPGSVPGKPYRLAANAGKSFQGSIVLGMGFVLTPEEAQALIEKDPRNRDVLCPYLNGEDLNSRPDQSPSRWVINFHDWPIERARSYPDCWRIIEEKVMPERQRQKRNVQTGELEYVLRRPLPQRYWQYADKRPELYATIAGMERVLALCLVTHHVGFAFVPSDQVFAHRLVIFPIDDWPEFALLQSNIHEPWARTYSSQLETRLNYSPTDCFDTFPFPEDAALLDSVARMCYLHRQTIMQERQEGITKTYNRFHDPHETSTDVARLRDLHVEVDQAVADAYGWTDLGHGFHQTKQGLRFTISEDARREVLGRLLALNHERYEEEVRRGLHAKGGSGKARRKKTANGTMPLFGQEAS